ncbi:MAG: hypothetical protein QM747_19270 [Nocardioides sp.]
MRLRRPSVWLATISSAALLVVGLDYATYAVTGDSLLLGRANHSSSVTTLTRQGGGPALSLTSSGTSPSLRVSSSARVARLNADLLDGRHAKDLETRTVSFHAGARGDVLGGAGFWVTPVEPGAYQVSFKAFVFPDAVAPDSTLDVICGVADLNTLGPNTTVYTADSATFGNQFPALMSGADTVRIRNGANPGIVCSTSTGADFSLFKPISASFTRVDHRSLEVAESASPAATQPQRLFAQLHR